MSNLFQRVTRTRRARPKLIDWFYIRFEKKFQGGGGNEEEKRVQRTLSPS